MEVSKVVQYLRNFAPIRLAESWDNVGLLVEPVSKKRLVSKILLTIDLTEKVLDEAIRLDAPFIVAYHPPIFTAMKKLTSQTVKERIAVKAIENGIAIYSPHTTYDSLHGGVNDWLACAVTTSIPSSSSSSSSSTAAVSTQQGEHTVTVLQPHSFYNDGTFDTANPNNTNTPGFASLRATVFSPSANSTASDSKSPALNSLEKLQQSIGAIIGKSLTSTFSSSYDSANKLKLEFKCQPSHLSALSSLISSLSSLDVSWEAHTLEKLPQPSTGQGRLVTLAQPINLATAVARIKKHLKLENVRVALPLSSTSTSTSTDTSATTITAAASVLKSAENVKVKKVALCAGSGSTVLRGVNADLYLTGEMGHHDVLDAVSNGVAVVLCEHSNTERGYLTHLQTQLTEVFGGKDKMEIIVSAEDADPLVIV